MHATFNEFKRYTRNKNNERGVEFEETEKSRSRSEFGSKLNYSIIPRTTLPSSHIDDHDDDGEI